MSKVKTILLGDSTVGKTTLTYAFRGKDLDRIYNKTSSTIGMAFCVVSESKNKKNTKQMFIYDTAGQERFRSIVPSYIRNARIIISVYDCTNPETLEHLKTEWFPLIEKSLDTKDIILVVVENKTDLCKNQAPAVPTNFADQNLEDKFAKVIYAQVSAIRKQGTTELRQQIFDAMDEIFGVNNEIDKEDGIVHLLATPVLKIAKQSYAYVSGWGGCTIL